MGFECGAKAAPLLLLRRNWRTFSASTLHIQASAQWQFVYLQLQLTRKTWCVAIALLCLGIAVHFSWHST